MAKLTDKSVAKALGWVSLEPKAKDQRNHYWMKKERGLDGSQVLGLPAFTTDLTTIVAEIEARGLGWETCGTKDRHPNRSMVEHIIADGDTAALALCAALLAYLEAERKGDR